MKEIIAMVRTNMMNKTKEALLDIGVPAFFANQVLGRGKGLHAPQPQAANGEEPLEASVRTTEATLETGRLFSKRMLTVVVPDDVVDKVIATIISINQTGNPGDGKIFVLPMGNSVRVRTAESGEAAIV